MPIKWYDGSQSKPTQVARVVIVTEDADGPYTASYEWYFKSHSDAIDAMNQANQLLASLAQSVDFYRK